MIDHRVLGTTGYAARITRGDGAWTDVHHTVAPTGELAWEGAPDEAAPRGAVVPMDNRLARRVFATERVTPTGELPLGRVPLLFNDDVAIHHVAASGATDDVYVNADGDELAVVIEGGGVVLSAFGQLSFGGGEYVWLPRGVPHAWQLRGSARMLLVTFHGELRVPTRWRNGLGQLLPEAPYTHRDFRSPVHSWGSRGQPRSVDDRWRVLLRRDGALYQAHAVTHPLESVGWEGMVYPVALPWECAMMRGVGTATLFEHPGVTVDARVVRAGATGAAAGEDTVSLVVDGEGHTAITWTPGCVPGTVTGTEGALAVVIRAARPLALTASGAVMGAGP